MTLDSDYFDYAHRREGMDHDLYRWSNLFDRAPMVWPGGKKVLTWIVIDLEWFPITPDAKPFLAPGHMQTAYPDYRHYTSREYGTRVGFYRLLDALGKVGARAGVATNAAIAERYPSIVADVVAAGHEVIAHSIDMNGAIATGLPEADERDLIARSFDTLERVSGIRPRGWLSIARSQSWNTARLLAESGASYMLDWANDDLPYRFATQAGALIDVPLNHELSDRQVITVEQQSADSYGEQLRDAWQWLAGGARGTGGGRMLPIHLTPYITGLPYPIAAIEELLTWLATQKGNAFLTPGEIAACADSQLPPITGATP